MAPSDTDDDGLDNDNEFDEDGDGDADGDIDEELFEAINDVDEATEDGEDVRLAFQLASSRTKLFLGHNEW